MLQGGRLRCRVQSSFGDTTTAWHYKSDLKGCKLIHFSMKFSSFYPYHPHFFLILPGGYLPRGCSGFFNEGLFERTAPISARVFPVMKTRFCLELKPDISCTHC